MPKTFSKAVVMTAPDLVESNDQRSTGATINPHSPKAINDAGKVGEGGIAVLLSTGDTDFLGKPPVLSPSKMLSWLYVSIASGSSVSKLKLPMRFLPL